MVKGIGARHVKEAAIPLIKYRLHLGVFDKTAHTEVVLFDSVAEKLVKTSAHSLVAITGQFEGGVSLPRTLLNLANTYHKLELRSHTYYDHGSYETFACSDVLEDAIVWEDGMHPMYDSYVAPATPSVDDLLNAGSDEDTEDSCTSSATLSIRIDPEYDTNEAAQLGALTRKRHRNVVYSDDDA